MKTLTRVNLYVVLAAAVGIELLTGACASSWCTDCSGSQYPLSAEEVGTRAFEEQVASDLAGLFADVRLVASEAPAMGEERARDDALCDEEIGDCEVCWDLEGDASEGVATAVLDEEACERLDLVGELPGFYQVSASEVEVSWSGDGEGRYDLDATGLRVASLEVVLADGQEQVYGASWVLDLLTATTTGGVLDAASLDITYLDFDEHPWTIHVVASEGLLAGTASREDGSMCSITGNFDAVRVDCGMQ
jgi:hypothetical protein